MTAWLLRLWAALLDRRDPELAAVIRDIEAYR